MAEAVYVACALTSLLCTFLLLRSWLEGRSPLLLWCFICFAGLALNNILLLIDKALVTGTDLSVIRGVPAAVGVAALVAGLIWETRQ